MAAERKIKTSIAVTLMILIIGVIGTATLLIVGASVNELVRRLPEINVAVLEQERNVNAWLEKHNFIQSAPDEVEDGGQQLEVIVPGLVPAPEEQPQTPPQPGTEGNPSDSGPDPPEPGPSQTMPSRETGAADSAATPGERPTETRTGENPIPPGEKVAANPATEAANQPEMKNANEDENAGSQIAAVPGTDESERTDETAPEGPKTTDTAAEEAPQRPVIADLPASRIEVPYPNYIFGPQRLVIEVPSANGKRPVEPGYGGYFSPVEIFRWFLDSVWGISNYAFIVFLMLMFLLLEWSHFGKKLEMLPGNTQSYIEQVAEIFTSIRQYMFIKTLVSILTGLMVTIWLQILGTDYAPLWGIVAFLFNYIPTIGSIIAGVVPTLFVLIDEGPLASANVAIAFIVVNFLVGNVLEPRIMGEGLGLSTFVVFCSLVFWGFILGPAGMLLAVPLTMAIKIALASDERTKWIALLLGSGKPPRMGAAARRRTTAP